jgi:hypothetical protein
MLDIDSVLRYTEILVLADDASPKNNVSSGGVR